MAAFDSDFSDDDWDHALGGVHVIARRGDVVVGHAAVVQRQLIVDDRRVFRAGYVEAVAVSPTEQRGGIGGLLMHAVEEIIDAAYDFGALAASTAGMRLYLGRGWQTWTGPLHALTVDGRRPPTADDAGVVMVFGSAIDDTVVDLSSTLTADPRRGDQW